ncbi:YdcF family protein [Tomitella gaofuii]|uniref:YdcF family protein n=1 Tax=Tomitella gaofuii TaxID=2760083 RepID=UPI0015F90EF4|nr:YdcF family protein [Tomitella gaofuii]
MKVSTTTSASRSRGFSAFGAAAASVAIAAIAAITIPGTAGASSSPSALLESAGVPPRVAALADSGSLTVESVDLIPQAITAVSGSVGLPTTVSNAILSTVGGCQSNTAEAIIACTEDQTLTTEPPLSLRVNPANTDIVVLGAGLHEDGSMRPVLESRLRAALELANSFPAAPIIVTGGVPQSGRTEADAMFDWLVANGVPAERITKEGRSTSTVENAQFTDEILDARRSPAAVVVTSPGHLQRALVDFRKAVDGQRPIQGVVAP